MPGLVMLGVWIAIVLSYLAGIVGSFAAHGSAFMDQPPSERVCIAEAEGQVDVVVVTTGSECDVECLS